ncbi:hypothetical protein ABEX78_20700 [Priestia megaterium]
MKTYKGELNLLKKLVILIVLFVGSVGVTWQTASANSDVPKIYINGNLIKRL